MDSWRAVPDVAWVVEEPHSFFAGRELRTYGMCGYWDLSSPVEPQDGSTWLVPGIQGSLIDPSGHRRTAILKDTARIIMPHARYSRLDDPAARSVVISLGETPLRTVEVQAAQDGPRGDISMRGLLALITPLSVGELEFGSSFDARIQSSYHGSVTGHKANSVFFHDHASGVPQSLLLALSVQYGGHPARRNADFAHETVPAILFDDSGPGSGLVFCDTQRLSEEMLSFIGHAFRTSVAYQTFCKHHHKETRVRIVDSESRERHEVAPPVAPASDESFKKLVLEIEAEERRNRETERERWMLRLREITGLLDDL